MYSNKISRVICFPFISILSATGNPAVDFFSLDVEGVELPILKTIPWSKVNIKVSKIILAYSIDIYLLLVLLKILLFKRGCL